MIHYPACLLNTSATSSQPNWVAFWCNVQCLSLLVPLIRPLPILLVRFTQFSRIKMVTSWLHKQLFQISSGERQDGCDGHRGTVEWVSQPYLTNASCCCSQVDRQDVSPVNSQHSQQCHQSSQRSQQKVFVKSVEQWRKKWKSCKTLFETKLWRE